MKEKIFYISQVIKISTKPKKMWNAVKLHISYWLSALGILTNWKLAPIFISIEPTNICNLHCPECPVGIRKTSVKTANLDLEMARKLLDELGSTLIHTIFYFQGEPLLYKNFTELVKYTVKKNILTSTSTNAQMITDEMAKELVESGLHRLIISMDGATQATYEKYRVGASLEKTIKAVEYLVKWKKKLKSPSPFIEIQFLVLKTNEHQMDEMRELAKKLQANKLTFKTAQLYDVENGHELLPENDKYARYELRDDGKYHIKSPLVNRCKRLWQGSVITSKGDVLPCCFDKNSSHVFGNLNEKSFMQARYSDEAVQFRKSILKTRKQFEMCRNCSEK